MPFSIYQSSAPVFVHGLNVLAGLLDKAKAHAQAEGLDPATLVQARLAEDMYPFWPARYSTPATPPNSPSSA